MIHFFKDLKIKKKNVISALLVMAVLFVMFIFIDFNDNGNKLDGSLLGFINTEKESKEAAGDIESRIKKDPKEKAGKKKSSSEKDGEREDSNKKDAGKSQSEKNSDNKNSANIAGEKATNSSNSPSSPIMSLTAGTILSPSDIDMNNLDIYFVGQTIPDNVIKRIDGKSYPKDCRVPLSGLRYIKVLHYDYSHNIKVGEMIVASDIEADCLDIFKNLFINGYEINSMYLVDNFWTGDSASTDIASMEADNTSCFNYRPIAGKSTLSKHSTGHAIDINPFENPCITYPDGVASLSPQSATAYADRTIPKAHMIGQGDICLETFLNHGFNWGGNWTSLQDYQHFEK